MTQSQTKAQSGRIWPFLSALGLGQVCSWGSLYYSFPLIAEAMGRDMGWSKPDLYAPATVGLILAALIAYPVGSLIDRGHGRALMGGASVVAALLFALWSRVQDLQSFYVLAASLGALQAATLYEPAFAVAARRVGPVRVRAAITTLTLWGGFASTVFVPLVQFLLDRWGWREALMVLALINLTLCAGAYIGFIRSGADAGSGAHADPAIQALRNRQEVRLALRRPVFWALLVAFTAYAAMFSAFTYHMYPMLLERGINATAVVQAIALIGPSQVAARFLISRFAAQAPMRVIGMVVVATFPLVFAAFGLLPGTWFIAALGCAIYGAANGIFTIVRGLVVPEMLSRHAYGAINGLLAVPATLARALAPAGAAVLWTQTASYAPVLWGITGAGIVLAGGFWLAGWFSRDPRGHERRA